ncbi:hypothetical protein [Bradyrhizobium erythrophlei]|uniref:hypothetical protein n=1 Tax=Bradyrhizobium erythrophlei TaxID=1437360 RepID=UPI0018D4C436|nr:hypothetical protein [Bradyrhizobium erythrophlei]
MVQSLGCTASEAYQLVYYVFDRPVGEPMQELGGTLVTLHALASANDMDVDAAGETELARVWTKIEAIRAKQAQKPKHSPLPGLSVMPWRCFHCDEVFTDEAAAREHFGISEMEIPGCKLNALEGGLLGIVRRQEEQLEQYHREDTASYREFYALGADHYRALRSEEEKGYARGLKDARQETEAENVRLRAALARSKDPCVYCSLPAEELFKCNSGFPGCSRADDVMGCPELGAMLRAEEAETEVKRLTPYVDAFRREEDRADKLGRDLDDLRSTLKNAKPAIKALQEWFGFQSADNTNTLYNAAGKLFGSTFDPTEYDDVE